MSTVAADPGLHNDAEDLYVDTFVEGVRESELDSSDRLRRRAENGRSCLLVAEAWLRGGGCPWISMNVRSLAEGILTGRFVEAEEKE